MVSVGAIMKMTKVFANGKKAVTQTLNGKTMTQIFDQEGNLLKTRAKSIVRENVGNKKVVTVTKAGFKGTAADPSGVYKKIKDRVYTQEGQFLGQRNVYSGYIYGGEELLPTYAAQQIKDGNFYKRIKVGDRWIKQTDYWNGIRNRSTMLTPSGNLVYGAPQITFDSHGLPTFNVESYGLDKFV